MVDKPVCANSFKLLPLQWCYPTRGGNMCFSFTRAQLSFSYLIFGYSFLMVFETDLARTADSPLIYFSTFAWDYAIFKIFCQALFLWETKLSRDVLTSGFSIENPSYFVMLTLVWLWINKSVVWILTWNFLNIFTYCFSVYN